MRGQQATTRRVGVLIGTTENDPETKRRVQGLVQGLREAGWIEGQNIHLDYRFSGADPDLMRRYSTEIVALRTGRRLSVHSNDFLAVLRQSNRTIPTVFAQVGDPVGSGFVESLARPGGNLTGFTSFEAGIGGKWLQIVKEIAPGITRTLVLLDAKIGANLEFLHTAQSAASAIGVTVTAGAIQDVSELEHLIAKVRSRADWGSGRAAKYLWWLLIANELLRSPPSIAYLRFIHSAFLPSAAG